MKINELKRMIREEIARLNEYTDRSFTMPKLKKSDIRILSKRLGLVKTANSSPAATAELAKHVGDTVFVHVLYFVAKTNGNSPARPDYQLHQRQYWNNEGDWNVTELTVYIMEGDNRKMIGEYLVDTGTFLAESKVALQVSKVRS